MIAGGQVQPPGRGVEGAPKVPLTQAKQQRLEQENKQFKKALSESIKAGPQPFSWDVLCKIELDRGKIKSAKVMLDKGKMIFKKTGDMDTGDRYVVVAIPKRGLGKGSLPGWPKGDAKNPVVGRECVYAFMGKDGKYVKNLEDAVPSPGFTTLNDIKLAKKDAQRQAQWAQRQEARKQQMKATAGRDKGIKSATAARRHGGVEQYKKPSKPPAPPTEPATEKQPAEGKAKGKPVEGNK